MRKVISVLLVLMLVLVSVGVSYAATPRYVSVDNHVISFNINEDGVASYTASATPKLGSTVDRVTATVKIMNSSGTTVSTQTKTLTYSAISGAFSGYGTYQLKTRGTYSLQVTFKCYDGATLLETIPANAMYASW